MHCVCVCLHASKEAARRIKTDEIMMSGVVITFLAVSGGRGRKQVGRGHLNACCDHHMYAIAQLIPNHKTLIYSELM